MRKRPHVKERSEHAVLSEDGQVIPCDLLTWARFMDARQRIIIQETLPGDYWISTVFLGLNHNYYPDEAPLWFETMIFAPPTGISDILTGRIHPHGEDVFMDRYTTLQEAIAGHEAAKRWFERQDFYPK